MRGCEGRGAGVRAWKVRAWKGKSGGGSGGAGDVVTCPTRPHIRTPAQRPGGWILEARPSGASPPPIALTPPRHACESSHTSPRLANAAHRDAPADPSDHDPCTLGRVSFTGAPKKAHPPFTCRLVPTKDDPSTRSSPRTSTYPVIVTSSVREVPPDAVSPPSMSSPPATTRLCTAGGEESAPTPQVRCTMLALIVVDAGGAAT